MIKRSVTIFILMLSASILTAASLSQKDRIHNLVESGKFKEALTEGVDAVTLHPQDAALLHEVGRAAFRSERYHLAIYYFKRSLIFRPNYSASLLYLGWAQKRAGLKSESRQTFQYLNTADIDISKSVRGSVVEYLRQLGPKPIKNDSSSLYNKPNPYFYTVIPYAALLEYGGKSPKTSGDSFQTDLRLGLLNKGYMDFSETLTTIQESPGYPEYKAAEHRIGLAGFITPELLLKGKYAYVDVDYENDGDGHFAAIGLDWLRAGSLSGGLAASFAKYSDGDVIQIFPHIIWHKKPFDLTTTLSLEQSSLDGQSDEFLALIRQDLIIPFRSGDGISVGYAAGESSYGQAGFGDLLYSLPDKQTGSLYFRYIKPLYPFFLSFRTSLDTFKTDDGSYHSTAHTISLGYLSQSARSTISNLNTPWVLSFGAGSRKSSANLTMKAAAPLVTDVIDPVIFSDDSGDYTRIYAYDLETDLNEQNLECNENNLFPYVELRRLIEKKDANYSLSLYGRYMFTPYTAEFKSKQAGLQRVWESYSDLYTGTTFGGGRGVYATYDAIQQGRFDLNLHELALGTELESQLLPTFSTTISGGILVSIADWSSSDSTQWIKEGDSTILSWIDRKDSGQELLTGATVNLLLRWFPSADSSWFIELGGGYTWYGNLSIQSSPVSAQMDLSSSTATIGIGLR